MNSPKRPRSLSDEAVQKSEPVRKLLKYEKVELEFPDIEENFDDKDPGCDDNRCDVGQFKDENDATGADVYCGDEEVIVHDDVPEQKLPWCVDVSLSASTTESQDPEYEDGSDDDFSDVTLTPDMYDDDLLDNYKSLIAKFDPGTPEDEESTTDEETIRKSNLNETLECTDRFGRRKKRVSFRDPLDDSKDIEDDGKVFSNYTIEESTGESRVDFVTELQEDGLSPEEDCFKYLDDAIGEGQEDETMDFSDGNKDTDSENEDYKPCLDNVISVEDVVDEDGRNVIDNDVVDGRNVIDNDVVDGRNIIYNDVKDGENVIDDDVQQCSNGGSEVVNYGADLDFLADRIDEEQREKEEEQWKENLLSKFRKNIISPRRRISPRMRKALQCESSDKEENTTEQGKVFNRREERKRQTLEDFVNFYTDHAKKELTGGQRFQGVDKYGDQVFIDDVSEQDEKETDEGEQTFSDDVSTPGSECVVVDLLDNGVYVPEEKTDESDTVEGDSYDLPQQAQEIDQNSDLATPAVKNQSIRTNRTEQTDTTEEECCEIPQEAPEIDQDSSSATPGAENCGNISPVNGSPEIPKNRGQKNDRSKKSKNGIIKFLSTLACCFMCPSSYFVQYN